MISYARLSAPVEHEAEDAVVRPHPQVAAALQGEGASLGTYARIDDG